MSIHVEEKTQVYEETSQSKKTIRHFKTKKCIICKKIFKPKTRDFTKTCGKRCSKKNHIKGVVKWQTKNPNRVKENQTNWNRDNRKKIQKNGAIYYKKNRKKLQKNSKEWFKRHPEEVKIMQNNSRLKRCYGIKKIDYDNILKKQNNRCAICNKNNSEFKRTFAVDHNHKTKKIRGLLCINCNIGIGKFKDNIKLLKKAIKYLNKNGVK